MLRGQAFMSYDSVNKIMFLYGAVKPIQVLLLTLWKAHVVV